MRNFAIALAAIAALTLGALSTADAQDKGRRDGAGNQRQSTVQHRAGPRNFQRAVDRRQATQRGRMRQGRRAGDLNRHEVSRLRQDQRRIRKLERRFGSDGHYTRHERRALKGALDRSSKRIYRMKHNRHGWKRGHGKPRRFHKRFHKPYHKRYHKRYHRGFRRPHHYYREVHRVYPVADSAPVETRGLEVETPEFRFKVYGSS
jgi:hypothetical protein